MLPLTLLPIALVLRLSVFCILSAVIVARIPVTIEWSSRTVAPLQVSRLGVSRMLTIRGILFLSFIVVIWFTCTVVSVIIFFCMFCRILSSFIVLTDSVNWRSWCCYWTLVRSSWGGSWITSRSTSRSRRLLCILLLIFSRIVRSSRWWNWSVRSTIRRRSLSWDSLNSSRVISIVWNIKCSSDVLDGVCGVGLVMRRRCVSRVVALIV